MATHYSETDSVLNLQQKCCNPNYSGPNLETIASSAVARSKSIAYLQQYEFLREAVLQAKLRFGKLFISQLNSMGTRIEEQWVEGCKARDKELRDMLARIIDSDETLELVVVARTATGYTEKVYSLEDAGYCPTKFSIIGISENEEVVDVFINTKQPKIYGCLFVAMFKVAQACRETMYTDEALSSSLRDLALSIVEIAGLYNETSPDSEHWKLQELNTLKILTNPPTREDDDEIMKCFLHVIEDIRIGKKPYVKEISDAIRSRKRYCSSPYQDDDYYFSIKSDPAYIPNFKYKQSLIKSMVETDPLAGCEFDRVTGYVSHYNKVAPKGYQAPWIKTIHIPNPGKYKTRAIHLALSALQDRCCYIHNRLFSVLKMIPSDCTDSQEKGQAFTCRISDPDYRESHGWSSVLAFDWSNATDKMWQWFQEECLKLIFCDEVVDFWHTISTCDKVFYHKDGTRTPYKQINGQPQGLLGSFDAFAFAHHIIMLMTMSLSGLEEYVGSEFYRVLGDDSIISSIEFDPANIVGDNYCRICSWANMEINRSKSTEVLNTQKVALVDFAKVTILNGEYFSPIPERLANRIGKHNQDYYAFSSALWQGKHGYFKPDWIKSLVDFYYKDPVDNKLAHLLIESGTLPSFRAIGMYDPSLEDRDEVLALNLCYAIQKVKASMLMALLGDKIKENLDILDKETNEDSLSCLIPPDLESVWDKVEDIDHKVNIAIDNNLAKEATIKEIMSCSQDQARVLSAGLQLTDEEFRTLTSSLAIMDAVSINPSNLSIFKREILNLMDNLKSLNRLQYRSLYKQNALDAIILRRSIRTFKSIFSDLIDGSELSKDTEGTVLS